MRKAIVLCSHAVVVPFVVYHLCSAVNWYVVCEHWQMLVPAFLVPLFVSSALALAFLTYFYVSTLNWFNSWIYAVPNYLHKEPLALGVAVTLASVALFLQRPTFRKGLLVATALTGTLHSALRAPWLLGLHAALALVFLGSLMANYHLFFWALNYPTYVYRRVRGSL